MLSKEQVEQIKQQIIDHIERSFPEDKKASAKQQVESMDEQGLEQFLMQNNLIKQGDPQQCIFCSILSGKIPSYKIGENGNAIAVLEINPISRGHTMIIPRPHVQEVSEETQDFAKQLSLKLKEKLSAKGMQIEDSEMFGHKTINIIPIYDDETLGGKRQPAPKKILEDLQKELIIKEESKPEEPEEKKEPEEPEIITDKEAWLPRRIP